MERENAGTSPALSSSFLADVERTVFNMKDMFNPLHDDYALDFHVQRVDKDQVVLSIAMPEGMVRGFVPLLQSLHGFFRFAELKLRIQKSEEAAIDPREIERRKESLAKFRKYVCQIYDGLISQGLERKEAVKRTNQALKAKKHPWANRSTIEDVLRAAGKFRRKGV